LGSSHAAATLAIVLVGFDLKLFDESVLNGTVILILVSCIVSTFITEIAAKKIAVADLQRSATDETDFDEQRILVPLANPANFEQLMDFAIYIKNEKEKDIPIFPLSVVADDDGAKRNILLNDRLFSKIKTHAAAADIPLNVVQRVERNVASGISSAARDLAISDIVIGWSGKSSAVDFFFGSIMLQVLGNAEQTVLVSKMVQPYSFLKKMTIVMAENATLESGFAHSMTLLYRLSKQLDARVTFLTNAEQHIVLKDFFKKEKMNFNQLQFKNTADWDDWQEHATTWNNDELWLFICAREHTLSYTRPMTQLPKQLSTEFFEQKSFVLVYPTQQLLTVINEPFLG
jgi:hypothetical protein